MEQIIKIINHFIKRLIVLNLITENVIRCSKSALRLNVIHPFAILRVGKDNQERYKTYNTVVGIDYKKIGKEGYLTNF